MQKSHARFGGYDDLGLEAPGAGVAGLGAGLCVGGCGWVGGDRRGDWVGRCRGTHTQRGWTHRRGKQYIHTYAYRPTADKGNKTYLADSVVGGPHGLQLAEVALGRRLSIDVGACVDQAIEWKPQSSLGLSSLGQSRSMWVDSTQGLYYTHHMHARMHARTVRGLYLRYFLRHSTLSWQRWHRPCDRSDDRVRV